MIDAKPFHFYLETVAGAASSIHFVEPARARSWEWTCHREGDVFVQHLRIEKEISEKSIWIAKSISDKIEFPSLRIEIRSPFHNVDLSFKAVRCTSIVKPSQDAKVFEDLYFEFESVDYQFVSIEAGIAIGQSRAEVKARHRVGI